MDTARLRLPLLLTLTLAALSLGACCGDASQAPPGASAPTIPAPATAGGAEALDAAGASGQSGIDQAWDETHAALKDRDLSPDVRASRLESFVERYGEPPRYAQRIAGYRRSLRYQQERAQRDAAEPELSRRFLQGTLPQTGAEVAYYTLKWGSRSKDTLQPPITLELIEGVKATREHPAMFSLGAVHGAASSLARKRVDAAQLQLPEGAAHYVRDAATLNAVLRERLGGDLFSTTEPGVVNKAPLKKLLDAAQVAPDAPFLGTTAKAAWPVFQPAARAHARAYLVLRDDVGRKKVVAAYREARKKFPDTPNERYNSDMLGFYDTFTTEHGLDDAVDGWHGAEVIAGFWMRRMADGTDALLWDALRKTLEAYDPDGLKAIEADK